jgi:hypothetical protein
MEMEKDRKNNEKLVRVLAYSTYQYFLAHPENLFFATVMGGLAGQMSSDYIILEFEYILREMLKRMNEIQKENEEEKQKGGR